MSVKKISVGLAGMLLIVLVGCSSGDTGQVDEAPRASDTATPEVSETAEIFPQLTDDELSGIFTSLQFVPNEYGTTSELFDSIYPGLTTSDPSCLTPFGVGWDEDAALTDVTLAFGTSNDRSLTAVVASIGDAGLASNLVAESEDALVRCADETDLFVMQGTVVQTQVEPFDAALTGTDEVLGWRVTGDVGGALFTLVGMTARVGGDVVALVGWDSATNEANVPLATQMFVDEF